MNILISPDSFKGTYSAQEVADAIASGVSSGGDTPVCLPVADGGEGTFSALSQTLEARIIPVDTQNPWGQPVSAEIAVVPELDTAIVELAQASGLHTSHDGDQDPWEASTYGTGILIHAAAQLGVSEILVAAGGSATTDGGKGAVHAIQERGGLGVASVTVLSDVTTTFTETARVFGPQKGADSSTVEKLTARLKSQACSYPRDPTTIPRSGAAGGFAGGMWAYFGARLVSGADHVLDLINFDRLLTVADAVVVGEGRLDAQTDQGKIIDALLRRVHDSDPRLPVFAVVGSVDENLGKYASNFAGIIVASDTSAMSRAGETISHRIRELVYADSLKPHHG